MMSAFVLANQPVEMHVDKILPRRSPPMASRRGFNVLATERLGQQRIRHQVNLADGQVVGARQYASMRESCWSESGSDMEGRPQIAVVSRNSRTAGGLLIDGRIENSAMIFPKETTIMDDGKLQLLLDRAEISDVNCVTRPAWIRVTGRCPLMLHR